ncbi:carboxyvinyl-carboxyphosphonate phosphorylmutase [Streptomyces sp. CB00455]|uniref:isocitrate lyase/PEP mutase family protein n=1 Tax=Streptomyces sp. CB00455 TaxID=1703927 RepID=UPI00093BD241|nr:isocitrate lyase/PEP mutase family protein [Streptomyces sp. CB00455]OKK22243.1 carboxyvinyl-carboxyphosphonate phosphorylmutase [Streptomyces sp. CB00455]
MVGGQFGTALRASVAEPGTTPLIGVYDMYSASVAAGHYEGLFVSGFGFAASFYGLPDIGFIAWPDMVAFTERLRAAFPGHHLLVDIDDGYGDPEVAAHVVRRLERAGASGVVLEDQQRPRRCGHADGKQILPLGQYLDKLERVLDARGDLFVVARTDATQEPEMLLRAGALAATGADMVLVDGVRSSAQLERIRAAAGDKPLLFNQIAGGRSPRFSLTELSGLGVDAAVYSTPCLFAAHRAMEAALTELKSGDGRLPEVDGAAVDGAAVGVALSTDLLTRNLGRPRPAALPSPAR